MRTTFTPAPDIADRIYEIARKSQKSLNEVVNDLIRKGLNDKPQIKESSARYRVEPLDLQLRPGLDEERLSKISQELDDEELIRRSDHS
ncbi:MAG: hypothetical protein JST12_06250 [Armatimonadetes bacterium]|nr:hypothetical protein [Armatimonadota bacterium]